MRAKFNKNIVYTYDDSIGTFSYSIGAYGHPMKPLRVAMTNELIKQYKLDKEMESIVK